MDTPKEMSVAIDIDDRLTKMEEIQEAAIPIDDRLTEMEEIQEAAIPMDDRLTEMQEIQEGAIPKDSQSAETTHGMMKVEGELQTFIEKRLSELPGDGPSDSFYDPIGARTIFRLPNHELKKELCEPKLVSIGPYHRGKPSLRTMEHQKWFMLRGFLRRNMDVGLEVYLDAMKSLEAHARLIYSEPVDLACNDFALMLLLDSCFILEWLSCLRDGDKCYRIFGTGWNVLDIFYDLCLMENQVPFNVIHTLLTIQDQGVGWSPRCKSEVGGPSCPLVDLINLMLEALNAFHLIKFNPIDSPIYSCSSFWHLLHFYYDGVTSAFDSPKTTSTDEQGRSRASDCTQQTQSDHGKSHSIFSSDCFPCSKLFTKSSKAASGSSQNSHYINLKDIHIMCVSELCDAGVKFKKKKNPKHMLDISFEKGIFKMPFLKIDGHFVRILWNLVAYEQTMVENFYDSTSTILSSYLALMDSLINTEKDVAILERAGIVDNYFSNAEEAAVFFNQFGKLFVLDYEDHYFFRLFKDVKEYSESTWHKNRAKLVQDYFNNPWAIISVVAAVVLFVLTILQTYFSAMSV